MYLWNHDSQILETNAEAEKSNVVRYYLSSGLLKTEIIKFVLLVLEKEEILLHPQQRTNQRHEIYTHIRSNEKKK